MSLIIYEKQSMTVHRKLEIRADLENTKVGSIYLTVYCFIILIFYVSDDHENPCEKICMMGKIAIKISGPVKHGDFIYASPKLPGVGVTEEQLCADRGKVQKYFLCVSVMFFI